MPEEKRSLKQNLYRQSPIPLSDYISLTELARQLEAELDQLQPLIDCNYLRILSASETFAETVVARPLPAAMDWLRTMFMPLDLRPLISCKQICDALGITEDDFRYLCLSDGVPVYRDKAFGELISVSGFYILQQGWLRMANPLRSDRQALMLILGILKGKKPAGRTRPLPYSERLENELQRIVAMEEPDRTLRATDFWKSYNLADTLTDCLKEIEPPKAPVRNRRLKRRVEVMGERMERQGGKTIPTESECADGAVSGVLPSGR